MEFSSKKYDIFGICNALMDILSPVDDTFLQDVQLTKGVMHLVDQHQQQNLHDRLGPHSVNQELGGSTMNAIRTLAALGHRTAFAGVIGNDAFGQKISERMSELGIASFLHKAPKPTGTCLIFISPDGERTMVTHLGASRHYGPQQVPTAEIAASKIFHVTGYQWDTQEQKEAVTLALKESKKANTLVSFDLADPFVVEKHQADFLEIIKEYADFVFLNAEEARHLTGKSPEDTARELSSIKSDRMVVVKQGGKGAVVGQRGELHRIDPVPTKVVDTTAAGDMFAAGFLHGFLRGKPILHCGRTASLLASDVISRIGAVISADALKRVV